MGINTVQIHFQNTANFLSTIFQRNNNYPVRIVYTEMLQYPFEENWADDVLKLRHMCGLSMDEWKYLIKCSVKNHALKCLTKTCDENKKTQHILS